MLRFDVPPVPANVIRVEASITWLLSGAALAFGAPWLLIVSLIQGLVRGFIGHQKCPSHWLWRAALHKLNRAGPLENAGAKMFANKILFIASAVSIALWLSGSNLWMVPCTALFIFSFMEWAFSFCAACWAYSGWYRLRDKLKGE
jgi:Domain of unknown function (DUF4395)